MISISTFWSSIEIPGMSWGKERERASESTPMLMVRVEFSGEHFLPINHIPGRIFGMEEDQFRASGRAIPYFYKGCVKYDNDTRIPSVLYQNVTFVGTDVAVFAKGEEREDPKEGLMTVIDIPFLKFGFPQNIFLDVDKLESDLVRYAKTKNAPLPPDQRKRLGALREEVHEIEDDFCEPLVQKRLSALPYVIEAVIVPGKRQVDQKNGRIKVIISRDQFRNHFHSELVIPKAQVWIHAKASASGVSSYKRAIMRDYDLRSEDVPNRMYANSQIVLNASVAPLTLAQSFEHHVRAMNAYWAKNPKKWNLFNSSKIL